VKNVLTIVLAWASLVFMLTFVAAGSFKYEPTPETDAQPAYKVVATLASMGLTATGEPARRGPYYVTHARDRRGAELRVVADAEFGDILSVTPAQNNTSQLYQRSPHIIHVPQVRAAAAGSANDDIGDRADPAASDEDGNDEAAPPARRRVAPVDAPLRPRAPRWQPRSDAPPQTVEPRRAVLSVPPQALGPTPIRPIPRLNPKADAPSSETPNGG
jgi:hypothetical protein